MKRKNTRIIAFACLIAMLLTGCGKYGNDNPGSSGGAEQTTGPVQKNPGSATIESAVWQAPALTYGVLEAEPLAVLPWNSGRGAATSRNNWIETPDGYYFMPGSFLYYADKSDLTSWIPVCNQPDCEHNPDSWADGMARCNADLGWGEIVAKDNRIHFMTTSNNFPHLAPNYKANGFLLASMALDGTDKKLAYDLEEAVFSGAGMLTGFITSRYWLYYTDYLDKEGNTARKLFYTGEDGTREIPLNTSKASGKIIRFHYGDEAFLCNVIDGFEYGAFRFADGELKGVELDDLKADLDWSYLSGNTLRVYRPNDGYYDIDLTTREETMVAPAQFENGYAHVVLPNCIIETTLFDNRQYKDKTREMRLFDGTAWRTVELPEELAESKEAFQDALPVFTVTSDSVFFLCRKKETGDYLYRIPLGTDTLVAEFCAEIG